MLNESVITLLTREWDGKLGVERSWRRVLPRDDQLSETKRGLAWLGYWMSSNNLMECSKHQAVDELQKWLKGRAGVGKLSPQDLLGLGQDAQVLEYGRAEVLPRSPSSIRFKHRLLQEFMTASALSVEEGLLTQDALEKWIQDTSWWETLLMLGGLTGDHPALVRATLGNGRDESRLFLTLGLLGCVDKPEKDLERQVQAVLLQNVREGVTTECKRAAAELASLAEDAVIEALSELLTEEDQNLYEGVIALLEAMKSRKAAQVLTTYLRDRTLADQAAQALVSIGEPAVEPLINMLRDPLYLARQNAQAALEQIGSPAVEAVIALLGDGDASVRGRAAELLGQTGDVRAVRPLTRALSDQDLWVRRASRKALEKKGRPIIDQLIVALKDEDGEVSQDAARALGQSGDDRAIAPLIAAF
jgi:HEAT repeats/PBS lyase HEAT-like repeat